MADNMKLKMEILAKARGALHAFDQVDSKIQKVSKRMGEMRSGARMAFGGIGKIMNVGVIAPLKMLAGVATVAGGILAGVGMASLSTAGNFESLQLRLEAVTGSAEKAARIFKETSIYSAATPFQLDDLIDARILLEGIGVSGARSVAMVANAAASMGRNVSDTASLIAGLEAEPLRRLGIQLKTNMGKYQFEFRDKMGNIKKLAAEGADAARKELLSIFETKFGGATGRLAGSLFGKFSTLKDNVKLALAEFGAGMNPAAKDFIDTLTERISKMRDSGVFKEWGEKVGRWLEDGVNKFKSVLTTLSEIWAKVQAAPEQLKNVIMSALKGGAEGLGIALLGTLKALGAMWMAVGKMIGMGLLNVAGESGLLPKKVAKKVSGMMPGVTDDFFKTAKETVPKIYNALIEGGVAAENTFKTEMAARGMELTGREPVMVGATAPERSMLNTPKDWENIGRTTVTINGGVVVQASNVTQMERALAEKANSLKAGRAGS